MYRQLRASFSPFHLFGLSTFYAGIDSIYFAASRRYQRRCALVSSPNGLPTEALALSFYRRSVKPPSPSVSCRESIGLPLSDEIAQHVPQKRGLYEPRYLNCICRDEETAVRVSRSVAGKLVTCICVSVFQKSSISMDFQLVLLHTPACRHSAIGQRPGQLNRPANSISGKVIESNTLQTAHMLL